MSPSREALAKPLPRGLLRLVGGRSPRLRWGERVPLEPVSGGLLIDLRRLDFAEPMLALRLNACAAVQEAAGERFLVMAPRRPRVSSYLARTGLTLLPAPRPRQAGDILLPATRIRHPAEVEPVGEVLQHALAGLPGELASGEGPMMRAFSELCDNACTHGRSEHGMFLLVQRLGSRRLALVVGDLGIGIPQHLGSAHPELGVSDEGRLIVKALEPGVSGAGGRRPRGGGLPRIIEAIQDSQFARYELRIWSDTGRVHTGRPLESPRGRLVSSFTHGTWTEVVLTT
jgi:hypothetical protein